MMMRKRTQDFFLEFQSANNEIDYSELYVNKDKKLMLNSSHHFYQPNSEPPGLQHVK